MNRLTQFVSLAALSCLAASSLAGDHNHISVDTASGTPGDQVLIRVGYLPAESAFSIDGGRLLHDGEIHHYTTTGQLAQAGPLHDWFAGDAIVLTSDFFFATGRLDGGDFHYEMAGIEIVQGHHAPVMAWGEFHGGGFEPLGFSDAADRAGRSYRVGLGGHAHGQAFVFSEEGTFDVTVIAWDAAGVYADSDPVIIRVVVGGTACAADFNADGHADSQDFFDYLNAFFALEHAADFNHDEVVNSQDFFEFLSAFFMGCP